MSRLQSTLVTLLTIFFSMADGAVLIPEKRWPQHSTLNVWFLNGTDSQQSLVKHTAIRWSHYSNIKFLFFSHQPPPQTHVRISFEGYDGTMLGDHGDYLNHEPTMRLASITRQHISNASKKRTILHEFGHVLGLEHEFIHPHWPYGFQWLEHQATQCESKLANVLPPQTIIKDCQRLNNPLAEDKVWWFPFDEQSIMMYPIDKQWLAQRDTSIKEPLILSNIDKMAVQLSYPKHISSYTSNPIASLYSVLVDNRCNQPLSLAMKSGTGPQLKLSLRAYERSERIATDSPNVLISATANNKLNPWPSGWLTVNLNHAESRPTVLPVYCR